MWVLCVSRWHTESMGVPTNKSSVAAAREVFLNLRIDPEVKEQLERLALKNERTLAGEVRLALRRHLKEAA